MTRMTRTTTPTCVGCGSDLVLQIDPAAPRDGRATVLLADPPFRFACADPGCCHPETVL